MYYAKKLGDKFETISEHGLCVQSFFNYEDFTILRSLLKTFTCRNEGLSEFGLNYCKTLFENMLKDHDFGKYSQQFQEHKMLNNVGEGFLGNTNHSLKGAVYYYYSESYKIEGLFTRREQRLVKQVILLNAYTIARHHTVLQDFPEFLERLKQFKLEELPQLNEKPFVEYFNITDDLQNMLTVSMQITTNNFFTHEVLAYLRLSRGILANCDHYASYYFETNQRVAFKRVDSEFVERARTNYSQTPFYDSINQPQTSEMMRLRVDFIRELDKNLAQAHTKGVNYLEAPTGVGKTHLSLRYALNKLEVGKKIIYSTAFNNVSEQTYAFYDSILDVDSDFRISLNNSISEIQHLDEDLLDESYFRHQNLEYQFSIISNQKLLNIIFGKSLSDAKAYASIKDSIIVLDELQNVEVSLWKPFIEQLNILCEHFGCSVLLMSATLPRITKLCDINGYELIQDRTLINHPLFLNRVLIKPDLFTETANRDVLERLKELLLENIDKRQAVEFISKKEARNYHKQLLEMDLGVPIFLLTGDTSSFERLEIISKINETLDSEYVLKNFILIATQVIEAGLDIDCQIGYKDTSLYDSEIQFQGRINRHNKETGLFYPFNLTNSKFLYDNLRTLSLAGSYLDNLILRNYDAYFNKIIDILKIADNNFDNLLSNGLLRGISDYKDIGKETTSIYILETKHGLNSIELLETYSTIKYSNIKYAEKQILLSKLAKNMSYFTKTIYLSNKTINRLTEFGIDVDSKSIKAVTPTQYEQLLN